MTLLYQQGREVAFRVKLITGLAFLGAFLGALAWTHTQIFAVAGLDSDAMAYLRTIWRVLTRADTQHIGLHIELMLAAAAGAAALTLPALAIMFKSTKKKGV